MDQMKKSLNILIISCDWRNIFETGFDEMYKKLERDHLNPDFNNFFFVSWANESYYKKINERFFSAHVKTRWHYFRPFFDFMSIFVVPTNLKKFKFKPDIILVSDFGFLPAAKIVKMFFGGKIVMCLTNMPRVYSKTRKFGSIKLIYSFFMERAFNRIIDYLYTINETMKNYAAGLGIKKEKIIIFASDTINRDMHHINNSCKGVIKNKYCLTVDKKIIMSVGRLEAEKDFPRLLNIFSKLDKNYILIILGQGSLKGFLEKLAIDLDIRDRVIFSGFIGRDEIWNYYKDADLFILLSKAEALGLVFWEAMYMGVPVIGSMALGIVETIGKNGDRGFLLNNNEEFDSIKNKIGSCVGNSEDKKKMLERAKKYVDLQISNNLNINKLIV